jgi:hypothetical protein
MSATIDFGCPVTATTYTGSGSGLTSIPVETGLTATTLNAILLSNGSGVITPQIIPLTIAQGGTNATTLASGFIKSNGTTFSSSSSIVDADITGPITRTKLATGTANHVLINGAGGAISSEAQLAFTRGGLAADVSAQTGLVALNGGGAATYIAYGPAIANSTILQRTATGGGNISSLTVTGTTGSNYFRMTTFGVLTTPAAPAPASVSSIPLTKVGANGTHYKVNISVVAGVVSSPNLAVGLYGSVSYDITFKMLSATATSVSGPINISRTGQSPYNNLNATVTLTSTLSVLITPQGNTGTVTDFSVVYAIQTLDF